MDEAEPEVDVGDTAYAPMTGLPETEIGCNNVAQTFDYSTWLESRQISKQRGRLAIVSVILSGARNTDPSPDLLREG